MVASAAISGFSRRNLSDDGITMPRYNNKPPSLEGEVLLTFWTGAISISVDSKVSDLQEALKAKYTSTLNSRLNPFAVDLYRLRQPRELAKDTAQTEFPNLTVLKEKTVGVRSRARISTLSTDEDYVAVLLCERSQAPATPSPAVSEDLDDEARDVVVKREKDFKKFVQRLVTNKTPSVLAKSAEYNINQSSINTALLDGRFTLTGPSTVAPPVELYHPVFGRFIQRCKEEIEIPEEILLHTASLLRSASRVAVKESPRDTDSRDILTQILGVPLEHISNQDKSSSDYMSVALTSMGINAASMVTEVKAEMGSGGSDPSTQSALSYARFYCRPERTQIRESCSCPAFLIGLAGPWIVVMGAIFTSRPIVQRLVPYEWLGRSRLFDDRQVLRIARLLYALRLSVVELNEYYAKLRQPDIVRPGCIHPRFCPSITSFSIDKTRIPFVYDRPLEDNHACIVFKVTRTDTQTPVVIKFVRQYGCDAHRLMAANGMAPKLLSHTPLGGCYDELSVVAMEFVQGKTLEDVYDPSQPLPEPVKNRIREALDILAEGGFVFGDLRRTNVMLADGEEPLGERIRFIDFDWAAKDGEMRYPFDLADVVRWPSGASEHAWITREHQESMFRHL
ncbi:hypothetical protein D9757_005879 [Collybiopsis confluens]|uniref:Protein kinase domain-containing protein n=1 Tax=Collybiopsis confluens TaxID=2823264 RepID=A0A8H5HNB2_9AGAR|nr:hypothetical protein D9757_005879 [Collybiopsis confluens]